MHQWSRVCRRSHAPRADFSLSSLSEFAGDETGRIGLRRSDQNRLSPPGRALHDAHAAPGHAEGVGDKFHERLVGAAFDSWRGQAQLERFAV